MVCLWGGRGVGIFNLFMESLGVFLFNTGNYDAIIHSNFVLLSLLAVTRN